MHVVFVGQASLDQSFGSSRFYIAIDSGLQTSIEYCHNVEQPETGRGLTQRKVSLLLLYVEPAIHKQNVRLC